jgi:hypothetical protein
VPEIDFEGLDPTDFEEFAFELIASLDGFSNVDWRKGTPKQASPADRGRDIEAELERVDVDGSKHVEKWFVDCKHYDKGVPPEALQGILAWANAERPHVVLIVASGYLTNAAKDYISDYERNNRPPFRIKFWERPILDKLVDGKHELLERFLIGGMRSQSEIVAAEQEFFDRRWYERHMMLRDRVESGARTDIDPEIWERAQAAAKAIEDERPDIGPAGSDFDWGMWCGKHSALRWVLGEEWDFLDT